MNGDSAAQNTTPGSNNTSRGGRNRGQRRGRGRKPAGAGAVPEGAASTDAVNSTAAPGRAVQQNTRPPRNRRRGPARGGYTEEHAHIRLIPASTTAAQQALTASIPEITNATTAGAAILALNPEQGRQTESSRGRRGRDRRPFDRQRRGRGEVQGAPVHGDPVPTNARRTFGAQLSGAQPVGAPGAPPAEANVDRLPGDAPIYMPGQTVEREIVPAGPRTKNQRSRQGAGRGGRGGHHHAAGTRGAGGISVPVGQPVESLGPEDIMTRIHREIDTGNYECMVCYNNVTRKSKIWYCRCCWSVYHHQCVQKWAKQGLDTPTNRPIGVDGEPARTWRCPACNDPNEHVPGMYTCWCEKSIQPEQSRMLPPHSCGQSCGKQRTVPKDCPHACDLQCHAGPCLPCNSLGPSQACYCGSEESQRRCVDTDYENGWSCGQVCGDVMPCGEHICEMPCHPGLCGVCEVTEVLRCYCGNEMKPIRCCDKEEPKESSVEEDGEVDHWDGYYSCGKECERAYDCGEHHCKKPCHTQEAKPAHCPLSADVVTHCPCGKTRLSEILPEPRAKCTDPIPTCEQECGKRLRCGHSCQQKCHEGPCGICLRSVDITCQCGKTTSKTLCHQGDPVDPPMCMRNCRVALNCGRHECGAKCCSGEVKAQERLSIKKKMRAFSSATPGRQTDDGFEPEHICTRPCGRPLKCGLHNCPMLCHRGPCGTCLEASFEELSCNCGRTVIQPPVPCGSKPPSCRFPCAREKECGHPTVPHDCHPDDEACPKCPYLTEKRCLCGKKTVKAVPCFRDVVSCGTHCGKKLSCGSHACQQMCHSGRCPEPCKQACSKPRSVCGHGCQEPCHAPFQCSEDKPCTQKITLQCACGGIKQDIKCGATKANPDGNKKELKCTDACRSRRLAMALQLDPDRDNDSPYSEETLSMYTKDRKWCSAIEDKLRSFSNKADSTRLQFQPMKKQLREFIHLLATDYGLDSESQDPEPYRAVRIKKPSAFAGPPKKSLGEHLSTRPTPTPTPLSGLQQLKKPRGQAVNAFILAGTRIGLLAADLEKELAGTLADANLRFSIGWHGDEDVLLLPKPSSLAIDQIESELRNLAPNLKRVVAAKTLADTIELCWVGQDGRIANREGERWSVVNNKKAAAASSATPVVQPTRNRFDMTPVPKKKVEKKEVKEVVESWEMEMEEEEEREKAKAAVAAVAAATPDVITPLLEGTEPQVEAQADAADTPQDATTGLEPQPSTGSSLPPLPPVDIPEPVAATTVDSDASPTTFYEAVEQPLPEPEQSI